VTSIRNSIETHQDKVISVALSPCSEEFNLHIDNQSQSCTQTCADYDRSVRDELCGLSHLVSIDSQAIVS